MFLEDMNLLLTFFSDTPAVDSGVKQAQVLGGGGGGGGDSLVADVYPMKLANSLLICWRTTSGEDVQWINC